MRIRRYFKGAVIARMSSGTYCIIRPLGLVKGGKGLKHHENLLTLSAGGFVSKFIEVAGRLAGPIAVGRSGAPAREPYRGQAALDAPSHQA